MRWRAGTSPTDYTFTGQRAEAGLGLLDYRARFYDPVLGRFVSADTLVPDSGNPQDLNRYAYVRNNPLRYTDPRGHRVDPFGVGARENEPPSLVQARVFYLNEIGNVGGNVFLPNPDPVDRQGYILYRVGQVVGPENVKHIPIFKGDVWNTRLEMFGEMFEKRTWSPMVAEEIDQDIQERPLALGERLIIIGSSGGGTVAVESLDLLEEKGIYVDQVILRGSPVSLAPKTGPQVKVMKWCIMT